jgi:thioredoxin reductase (NADPH)
MTRPAVIVFARPHPKLPPQVSRDEHGFILTGSDLPRDGQPAARWTLARPPRPLETSMPGVFAAGDVRHGSVKRVASAVGEGSIAATQMTQYLQEQTRNSLARRSLRRRTDIAVDQVKQRQPRTT